MALRDTFIPQGRFKVGAFRPEFGLFSEISRKLLRQRNPRGGGFVLSMSADKTEIDNKADSPESRQSNCCSPPSLPKKKKQINANARKANEFNFALGVAPK